MLLDEPSGPVPLIEEEKARLKAEYTTLLLNSQDIQENSKVNTPEDLWYVLLTEKRYYENCLNVNDFALRFLTRSLNECVVEVQV